MGSSRSRDGEFRRWPKFKDAYMRAFEEMLRRRIKRYEEDPSRPVWIQGGSDMNHVTAQDVFNWWMEYNVMEGQINIFDDLSEEEEED